MAAICSDVARLAASSAAAGSRICRISQRSRMSRRFSPAFTNPSEYIGIGEVPVAPWTPSYPRFLTNLNETLPREHPDGFPHNSSADFELAAEGGFSQILCRAVFVGGPNDAKSDVRHDLVV